MGTVWQDLRHGLHALRRQPLYAGIAILSLALGIGATTAIFSVVSAVLLRPVPFRDGHRLIRMYIVPEGGSMTAAG